MSESPETRQERRRRLQREAQQRRRAKHTPERKEADRRKFREWRSRNHEAQLKRERAYGRANREARAAKDKAWYARNRQRACENGRRWRAENPAKIASYRSRANLKSFVITHRSYSSARRRHLLRSMPPWANLDAIAALYAEARRVSRETGILHHVDHDIPLRGRTVCGLHVETNLRVIPAVENWRKGNRVEL